MSSGFLGGGIGPTAIKRRSGRWYTAGGAPVPVAAYQPKRAASLAASYVNLANPGTYDVAPGTAPSFDTATGWTFNGSTQYLTTGVQPETGWTMLVRFSGFPLTGNNIICGSRTNAGTNSAYFLGAVDALGSNYMHYGHGQIVGTTPRIAAGVIGIAGAHGYRNGVADGATIGAANDAFAVIFVGARNLAGSANMFSACNVVALAIYNSTLTAGQIAAVSAAMAAL